MWRLTATDAESGVAYHTINGAVVLDSEHFAELKGRLVVGVGPAIGVGADGNSTTHWCGRANCPQRREKAATG